MRGVLAPLVLAATLSTVAAFELHYEQENSHKAACKVDAEFDVSHALHNDTLYQQVFAWMHKQDVQDWNYSTETRLDGTAQVPCALVSYKTLLASPTFFARLLRNFHMSIQFPIAVQKQVCLHGPVLVETATVTAPLIHELTMTARYDVRGGRVDTVLDAHYSLPWYIDFLVDDVANHLRSSFREKVDAVAESLCSHETTMSRLVIPAHAYLRRGKRPCNHPHCHPKTP
jgi:hypothetical protein